jgi:predicted GIY-YIG superfamily endonuclease
MRKSKSVFVYLLHFRQPIAPGKHTCQHYMGSAQDLMQRLAEHRTGQGARLCQVAIQRGIDWELARVWEAPAAEGRKLERKLKNQKRGPKLCPICSQVFEPLPDVNFYPMPADFAQGLEDFAKGVTYATAGQGHDEHGSMADEPGYAEGTQPWLY